MLQVSFKSMMKKMTRKIRKRIRERRNSCLMLSKTRKRKKARTKLKQKLLKLLKQKVRSLMLRKKKRIVKRRKRKKRLLNRKNLSRREMVVKKLKSQLQLHNSSTTGKILTLSLTPLRSKKFKSKKKLLTHLNLQIAKRR